MADALASGSSPLATMELRVVEESRIDAWIRSRFAFTVETGQVLQHEEPGAAHARARAREYLQQRDEFRHARGEPARWSAP
jgi:hypothetical protein